MHEGSRKAITAAFSANLGIAIAKFIGFLITGSAGLAAETVHSLADTGNQGLLFLGGRRSSRSRDEEHPFGHERERFFWAFIVALVLFSMGGLFAIYEGISKLRHPHETNNIGVAVVILVIAVILESYSLRTAIKEVSHIKPQAMSYWEYIKTSKSPELPTVLLEDIAAESGLVMALTGVVLSHLTGDPRWDAAGSLGIGILLVIVAFILGIEMKGLLMGESASLADRQSLVASLSTHPHVNKVVYMHTQHLGPDVILVAAKAIFDPGLSAAEVSRTIDEAEIVMRTAVPAARFIFIEPDVARQGG